MLFTLNINIFRYLTLTEKMSAVLEIVIKEIGGEKGGRYAQGDSLF